MTAPDLRGRGVLVTRPAGQAEGLCRLIEAAGGRAISVPAMEIEPAGDEATRATLTESWDLLYFVSPNAVEHGVRLAGDGRWPKAARLAAVGRGTARALAEAGRAPDLVPSARYESEALLAMPELAESEVHGWRVLIVRGEGGRGLFAETLAARGAEVHFAEVYRRRRPEIDPSALLARWPREIDAVSVTSEEVMRNLMAMLGPEGREQLLATPLVVIAERTRERAQELGFQRVELAERAADEAIVAALGRLFD